jgi:hypothetical protein
MKQTDIGITINAMKLTLNTKFPFYFVHLGFFVISSDQVIIISASDLLKLN